MADIKTFSQIPYTRPDFDKTYDSAKEILKQMEDAKSKEVLFAAMKELDTLSRGLHTQATLVQIRHTINTKDEFYAAENDVMDEALPRFAEISAEVARIILASPHREAVAEKYGEHLLEKYEVQTKTFKPEIVPDLVEEGKLVTQYEKLIASAQIEFDGKTLNLSGLGPYLESTDRQIRKEASGAFWGWLAGKQEELDGLYDQLVKLRHGIGKKLGFDNFIPVAYARMGRTDWDMQDARVYRQQILDSVVPLAQKLYKEQADRIGISDMQYYDYALEYLSGNPKPQGDEPVLVAHARKMYKELSPLTDAFFTEMVDKELMDLSNKPGKASGGYMTFLADYRLPFIFSNFNGTSGDVDVLTHEAGHAFQGYLQRDVELMDLSDYTSEVAEIHSMSMEFFAHPWMEGFFGPDTEKYYHSHVAGALKFLPYGASIDAFQEWVYLNPEATPEQRRAQFRVIEQQFSPHLNYEGNDYLAKGGRWQRQGHVYFAPFYYLDYTLSQVVALQYFAWNMKDPKAAWDSYVTLCKKSGQVPFKKLVPESGMESPFQAGVIAKSIPAIEAFMDGLDQSKIK